MKKGERQLQILSIKRKLKLILCPTLLDIWHRIALFGVSQTSAACDCRRSSNKTKINMTY